MLSVDEALETLLAGARPVAEIEQVSTLDATGRVLARAQASTMNVPPMDNSAMDGYAVAGRRGRARGAPAGGAAHCRRRVPQPLEPGTAARIFTGAPIPPGADAMVMQEFCATDGEHVIVNKVPQPEEWIRRRGSDIRAGGEVLAAGIRLRPQDTGLAASVGIKSLPVRRRLSLALFFTGDELVMPGDPLPPGRIYNSNRYTLNGLAQTFGCEVRDFGIVPDSLEATRAVLRRAAARRRPHRHLGRRLGGRGRPRQASGRGRGPLDVENRGQAGQAARLRRSRAGPPSSACPAIRCRAS